MVFLYLSTYIRSKPKPTAGIATDTKMGFLKSAFQKFLYLVYFFTACWQTLWTCITITGYLNSL